MENEVLKQAAPAAAVVAVEWVGSNAKEMDVTDVRVGSRSLAFTKDLTFNSSTLRLALVLWGSAAVSFPIASSSGKSFWAR